MRHVCATAAVLGFFLINGFLLPVCAQEKAAGSSSVTTATSSETKGKGEEEGKEKKIHKLDDILVEGEAGAEGIRIQPGKTIIDPDDFSMVGDKNNIQDLLKTNALFDFRGSTDLVPDSDTMTMRGFSSSRFVMAVDGLTVQKTGGRKGTHIVDYSLLSTLPIDSIEIIAGPHSALFDSKSIGGAVNIVTQAPERRDTPVPDATLSTSYSSYNTQNHKLSLNGAVDIVTYGANVQKQSTDGYLRYSETDIETYSGNLGLLLPYQGYINVEASNSEIERQVPVNNTGSDFDGSYPEVTDSSWDPYQDPTWDKEAWSYRLNYLQNLPIGHLSVNAYRSKENRHRDYSDWIDSSDHSLGTERTYWTTDWQQQGAKIQDIYKWSDTHETTIGYELARLYDGEDLDERVRKQGTYIQHRWGITPYLETRLGVRNEDVNIWVSNSVTSSNATLGEWVNREWNQWVPKTYTTLKMDKMADWLRDTSISFGVSKIWHAPDSHGEYNPQGKPAGAFLDPEHGIGYDLVLERRLFKDISLVLDTSFYRIKDYIVTNRSYAKYSKVSYGALAYSDYKINLDEVYRYGLEASLEGHIFDDLSFYATYAWQHFDNQGSEPAGETELDDEAAHRVTAGLSYRLFKKTALKLDYYFQSRESQVQSDVIGTDAYGEDIYSYTEVDNPAYSVFNFAVEQELFKDKYRLKDVRLQFYVKNILDEDYYDARGYLATDRTFGINLTIKM